MDTELIQQIKNQIITDNKLSTTKRKKYSPSVKESILNFMIENKISTHTTSKLFGVGFSTIDKWKRTSKPFKKMNVTPAVSKVTSSKKFKRNSIDLIKFNQIVLIFLVVLQIISNLFHW